MNRKQLTISLLVIAVVFSLFIGFLTLRMPKPVVIGYLGSLSGKYAHMGVSARDGAILAVEQVNASGGIRGRPVELLVMDDEGLPERAAASVENLAREGVHFLVGPFLSASGVAVLPLINRDQILTISPTTSSEELMDRDDFYMNISPGSRQFGKSISAQVTKLGLKKVVIILDGRNEAFCSPFKAGFMSGLENNSIFVEDIMLDEYREGILGETSKRAIARGPDGIVLCTSGMDSAILIQHLKRNDPDLMIFSSAWGMSVELLNNGGSAVDGMELFSAVNLMDKSNRYMNFEKSFRKRFAREPAMVSVLNYEAMRVFLKALNESSRISPRAVKSVLMDSKGYDGLQQRIVFDENGDAQLKLILHTVEGGLFVPQNLSK